MSTMLNRILQSILQNRVRRGAALILAIIVTFSTTYSLVLPAITIEKSVAESSPGMSMSGSEGTGSSSESGDASDDGGESSDSESAGSSDSEGSGSTEVAGETSENAAGETTVSFNAETTASTEDGKTQTIQVHVETSDAAFPEGTTMKAETVTDQNVLDTISDGVDGDVASVSAVSLTFKDASGDEVKPEDTLNVTMSSDAVTKDAASEAVSVVQYNEEGTEKAEENKTADAPETVQELETVTDPELKAEPADTLDQDTSVTFEADSSATFAIVEKVEEEENDASAVPGVGNPTGGSPEPAGIGTTEEAEPAEKTEEVPETDPAFAAEETPAEAGAAGTEELPAASVLDQIVQQVVNAEDLMLVVMEATTDDEEEPVTVRAEFMQGVFPEDVQLSVQTVVLNTEDTDAAIEAVEGTDVAESENVQVKALDITFFVEDEDGNRREVEPQNGEVRISMQAAFLETTAAAEVVHVEDDGTNTLMKTETDEETQEVTLTTDGFSVYAIVYTVDFHWEVDGKTYDFSIPGGGYVSFEKLVEVLGVAREEARDPQSEETEENDAQAETRLTLEDVEVSEATKKFVAEVEKVEFSNPELVWVGKVEEDTFVGALKEANGLEVEYSADLTTLQIAQINAQKAEAGDWALISLKAFDTEESLTVTMKNGEVFTIKVTDNQASDPLGLDNESFVITNGNHDRSLKAQADSNQGSLQAQNPTGDAINIWKFEYDENAFDGAGGYYLVCVINGNNYYLRVDGNNLGLAPVKPSEAQEGQMAATPFKVKYDHNTMRYRISGAADGNSAFLTFVNGGRNGRFSLSNIPSDNNLLALRDTNQPTSTPGTVGTWDIKSDGIVLKLFDYEGKVTYKTGGSGWWDPEVTHNNEDIDDAWGYQVSNQQLRDGQGINHDRSLLFSGSGLGNDELFNNFTGDKTNGTYYSGYAYQDIVNYNLGTDGFPVLRSDNIKTNTDRASGGSLAYLFNDSGIDNAKTPYTGDNDSGLNGLLRKDAEGYYYYDSEENFAKLVGDEVILYSDSYNKNKGNTDIKTEKIGLFPFDNYQSDKGEEKGPQGSVYNHQFGMTLSTDFIYPENGIVPETQHPMVFEFSGDDDVWVFVDGVLVLDLGGVHQPISGKIDFNSGKVTITEFGSNGVEYTSTKSTTIDAMFAKASQEAGKTITFDRTEYSKHKLDFFYLERGGCDSNCKIEFNLLTTKTITVEKKLEGLSEAELEKYKVQEFTVELCKKNSNADTGFELYNTEDNTNTDAEKNHTVRRDAEGNVIATGFPIKDGQISLKPGESVSISMLPTTASFHVAEIDQENMAAYETPTGERYYNGVKIEDIDLTERNSHKTDSVNAWQSADYAVRDTDKIVIINEPLHTSLTVNKLWGDGNENHTEDSIQFTVQATIPGEGEGAEPVPYTVSDIDGKVFEVTADSGWTRTIQNLPETNPDGKQITYSVTEVPVEGYTSTVTREGTAYTIVNTPGYLKIIKTVTYNNETPNSEQLNELEGTYTFGVFLDETCQTPYTQNGTAVTLTVEIDGNATAESQIIKLPLGIYWLKEETPENGAIPVQNGIRVNVTAQNTTENPAISNFTNNYNHGGPDEVILDVQKTFTGLTDKSHIPEGFYVRVSYKVDGVEDHVDLKNKSEGNVQWLESNDGMTWSWKVSGIPATAKDFKIQEFNSATTGYSPVVTILNGEEVDLTGEAQAAEVQMPTVTLDEVDYEIYSPDNEKVFPVDNNTIFLTRLTGSHGQSAGHTFVISNQTLSFRERAAVEKAIKGFNNNWVLPAEFYSIENNGTTFYYKGKTINVINAPFYNKHGDEISTPYQQAVKFSDTNQWTHTASYSMTIDYHETENAFEIVNSYEEIPVTVNVIKVKEGTTQRLSGAVFSLRKLDEPAEPTESGTFSGSEVTGSPFTSNENGEIAVQGLTHGYYELKEINAPPGYVLTNALPEYFKIEAGTVSWIEWKETEAGSGWVVKAAGDHVTFENATFTVENEPGVALPNTGGPGTTALTVSGAVLTVSAVLGYAWKEDKLRLRRKA